MRLPKGLLDALPMRRGATVCMALLVLGILSLVPPENASAYGVGGERIDSEFLIGYLTWQDGATKGGIAWDINAPTRDPGGVPPPNTLGASTLYYQLIDFYLERTTDVQAMPAPDVFTSEPLPRDLVINHSRTIHVDIFTYNESQECPVTPPRLDLEVRNSTVLITGGVGAHNQQPIGNDEPDLARDPAPPVQAGYCLVRHRMAAEVDVLAKGDRITLTVIHRGQGTDFRYGMGLGHRSIIAIPFFPPEEVVFRQNPALASTGGSTTVPESGAGDGPLWASLLLLFGAGRRRRLPLLLAALLLFAGCAAPGGVLEPSTGGPGAPAPKFEQKITPVDAGGPNGSITGTVIDEVGIPLARIHVSLLTASNFATTTARGRFTFLDVPPGRHILEAFQPDGPDKKGPFLAFRGEVKVAPSSVTTVIVPLAYSEARSSDQKPHSHSIWTDDELTLVPAGTPIPGSWTCSDTVDGETCHMARSFSLPIPLPHSSGGSPGIVPIGTRDVEVVLDWDVSKGERLGLAFGPYNERAYETALYPRGPGEPFHIRTDWEMSDPGHARATLWRLIAFRPAAEGETQLKVTQVPRSEPERITTNPFVTAHIRLHKGVVPFEPAHPDYWGANDSILVGTTSKSVVKLSSCNGCPPHGSRYDLVPFGHVVPMETQWIELKIELDRPLPGISFAVEYRGANASTPSCPTVRPEPSMTPLEGWTKDEAGYNRTAAIRVAPNMTDSAYALKSSWCLSVLYVNKLDYTYTVLAYARRDPMPVAEEPE